MAIITLEPDFQLASSATRLDFLNRCACARIELSNIFTINSASWASLNHNFVAHVETASRSIKDLLLFSVFLDRYEKEPDHSCKHKQSVID